MASGMEYTPLAAIVTEVTERDYAVAGEPPLLIEVVGLAVLDPDGIRFKRHVRFSDKPLSGCWTWPPRG
jgi:hypothetical protein